MIHNHGEIFPTDISGTVANWTNDYDKIYGNHDSFASNRPGVLQFIPVGLLLFLKKKMIGKSKLISQYVKKLCRSHRKHTSERTF